MEEDNNLGFSKLVRELDRIHGHTYEDPEEPGNDKAESETEAEEFIESNS